MTESKFRERRSAHRNETADEAAASAPPSSVPVAGEARPAEIVLPAEPTGPAPSIEIADRLDSDLRGEVPEGDTAVEEAGTEGTMDLDGLADMEVPEPSFLELIEPHVEMALRFLGELPLSPDGARRVLPRWARREIDLLGLLEQRTRGNLPPDEQRYLEQALDHLRTLYLKVNR